MTTIRHLIITVLLAAIFAAPIRAQAASSPFHVDTTKFVLQQTQPVAAQMHPAAKGGIIGAAVGAGTMGAIALWYCTIGPSEEGDCGRDMWRRGIPLYVGTGAAIGALIGGLK